MDASPIYVELKSHRDDVVVFLGHEADPHVRLELRGRPTIYMSSAEAQRVGDALIQASHLMRGACLRKALTSLVRSTFPGPRDPVQDGEIEWARKTVLELGDCDEFFVKVDGNGFRVGVGMEQDGSRYVKPPCPAEIVG